MQQPAAEGRSQPPRQGSGNDAVTAADMLARGRPGGGAEDPASAPPRALAPAGVSGLLGQAAGAAAAASSAPEASWVQPGSALQRAMAAASATAAALEGGSSQREQARQRAAPAVGAGGPAPAPLSAAARRASGRAGDGVAAPAPAAAQHAPHAPGPDASAAAPAPASAQQAGTPIWADADAQAASCSGCNEREPEGGVIEAQLREAAVGVFATAPSNGAAGVADVPGVQGHGDGRRGVSVAVAGEYVTYSFDEI